MTHVWAALMIAAASLGQADVRHEERFGLPPGRTLWRSSYVCVFNGRTRCPDVVVEYLTAKRLEGRLNREDSWRADKEVPIEFRPTPADYAGSGYDLGHMIPWADCQRSEDDARATFLVSQACPQLHGVNAGTWLRAERAVRDIVKRDDVAGAWVYSGPLWWAEEADRELRVVRIGRNGVWVPTHYFKVVLVEMRDGTLRAWALIVPHRERLGADVGLEAYAVAIDDVERASGLDLLAGLPDGDEDALEARDAKPFAVVAYPSPPGWVLPPATGARAGGAYGAIWARGGEKSASPSPHGPRRPA